jgi:hypothetical protein
MARKKDDEINTPPQPRLRPNDRKLAALRSSLPFGHVPLPDFERWIEAIEREPEKMVRIMATEAYVVRHEEDDPVSSRFYRIVGGPPPPGVYCHIGVVPTFIALAAASGVVGNLAYDALKKIVRSFLTSESKVTFEEKISFEEYETARKELHKDDARTDASTLSIVEKEVGLKHRLLIERKWTKE